MFCQKCGRQIPDQAKFCNYCGAQVTHAQAAPQQRPVQRPLQQPDPPKKNGTAGRFIVCALVALAVFFAVKYATQAVLTKPSSSSASPGSSTSSKSSGAVMNDTSVLDTCTYGALYQNGYLTYGWARLHIPGYSLMAQDTNDYLISSNETTLVDANKQFEGIKISFDATTEEGMLKSYTQRDDLTNVSMIDFRKDHVDGYPVVRYIVKCSVDNLEEYIGELIILPSETTNQTMRFSVETLAQNGYGGIDQIFDSLKISSAFELSYEDTQTMNLNRIIVK